MVQAYYTSSNKDFTIAHGDSFKLLKIFDFKFDMIFADPPYFLSMVAYHYKMEKSYVWIKASGIKVNHKRI